MTPNLIRCPCCLEHFCHEAYVEHLKEMRSALEMVDKYVGDPDAWMQDAALIHGVIQTALHKSEIKDKTV